MAKNLTAGTLVNNGNLQLKGSETLSITTKDTDSGTITYDGTATGLAYGNTYYNLAINSPSGTMTLMLILDVNGSLTISDGTLILATMISMLLEAGQIVDSFHLWHRKSNV